MDTATPARDASNGFSDFVSVGADFGELHHRMRLRIHSVDRHGVEIAEQFDGPCGTAVRKIHLRESGPRVHSHASGPVHHDGESGGEFVMFFLQLHRNG
jgi:hypothetical protein